MTTFSSPAKILMYWLQANAIGTDAATGLQTAPGQPYNWRLEAYKEPTDPDNVITLYNTTPIPDPIPGGLRTGYVYEHTGMSIRIRCVDYDGGWAVGRQIENLLATGTWSPSVNVPGDSSVYKIQRFSKTMGLNFLLEEPQSSRQVFTISGKMKILYPPGG